MFKKYYKILATSIIWIQNIFGVHFCNSMTKNDSHIFHDKNNSHLNSIGCIYNYMYLIKTINSFYKLVIIYSSKKLSYWFLLKFTQLYKLIFWYLVTWKYLSIFLHTSSINFIVWSNLAVNWFQMNLDAFKSYIESLKRSPK